MKVVLYIMWVASEDIVTQQRGLITIIWPDPETRMIPDYKMHVAAKKIVDGFPVRGCAMHMCFPENLGFRMLKAQIGLAMPKSFLQRLKLHLGTSTQQSKQ